MQLYDAMASCVSNGVFLKNPFCGYIQSVDKGKTLCRKNCHKQLKSAGARKTPFMFKCHAGLYGVVAPLYVREKNIGAVLCSGIHMPEQQKSFERIEIRKFNQLGFIKDEVLSRRSQLKKANGHSEEYIISFYDYVAKDISLMCEMVMAKKVGIETPFSLCEIKKKEKYAQSVPYTSNYPL